MAAILTRTANVHCKCLPAADWVRSEVTSTSDGTQLFFQDIDQQLLAERDDAKLSKTVHDIEHRGIGRIQLRDILLDGLNDATTQVQWNKSFVRYTRLPGCRLRAHFADGTHEDGDVLIGADGARSAIRQQYLPHIERLELGIHAISGRCVIDFKIRDILPAILINGPLNNIVPRGKRWMLVSSWTLPPLTDLTGVSEEEQQLVWAYVVPQEDDIPGLEALSPHSMQNLVLHSVAEWSTSLTTLVEHTNSSTINCIPLRSMPTLDHWEPSNVTLLGDAIHNMTPMAGVGVNTALRDAELLTKF